MVTYTFILTLEDTKQTYEYSQKLSQKQENAPESLRNSEMMDNIRRFFEEESDRQLNQKNLEKILTAWINDIKEGYRTTSMTLQLPSLKDQKLRRFKDSGNQTLPQLIEPDTKQIHPHKGSFPPLTFSFILSFVTLNFLYF